MTIPEALAIALRHHQAGRLQAAEQIYRQILTIEPNHFDAWHLLGVASAHLGRRQAGIECIRRSLTLKPDFADAHSNLGTLLLEQAKADEAVGCYRRALELKPDHAEAHNNLGNAFRDLGKLDEAVGCYRRALELKPDYAGGHNNLGNAFRDLGKLDEAVGCYRRALELMPELAGAHNNLGNALRDQGKLDEAVGCYRQALDLRSDYSQAYSNLGIVLQWQGKLDEAAACYRQAVQIEMRSFQSNRKDTNEPLASHQQGVQSSPPRAEALDTLAEAFGHLALLLQSRLPDDDLLAMQQLLSESILRDDGRAALEFGLAQALDARGNYEAAGDHLHGANAARQAVLKKRGREYTPEKQKAFTSGMMATFTPEFFARTSGFGLDTLQPVFIVGLPRSGTTLVEQILASHPRVFAAGELPYCEETVQSLSKAMNQGDTLFKCLLDLDQETARSIAQQHLDRLRAFDQRANRIVDKMPENFQHLGLIRVLFPRARLIHCHRDFRDVALSCRLTNFASFSWPCNTGHLVSYFEEYARLMDHWRNVLPSPPMDVVYGEMVEDTEAVARRVVDWCGLDWDPACLRFYETERPVRTASVAQVRRPIYKTSIGRWKSYEKQLSELFSKVHDIEETWFRGQQPGGSS
jgi:tetratricopeptide (TPR) repeat protein